MASTGQPAQTPDVTEADRAAIAELVRAASTSFYGAMRILPRRRREAIFAVYAFCREVDDIADADDRPAADRRVELDDWRGEVGALYTGTPRHPIARALVRPVADFDLRKKDFLAVIDGMEMDANGPVVAPSQAELDVYCDRVASAVGRLCVCIFGEPGEAGLAVAHHLGRALQLTNILRDVAEDAEIGRLYLPVEKLARHGITYDDPASVMLQPNYAALWREVAGDAKEAYRNAARALTACSAHKMRPARIMMAVYQRNFERMLALPDSAIADPAHSKRLVGKFEKFAIAIRHGFF